MINIVIPMAGSGKKFAERGYTFPKPLIELRGKPLIEIVVDNLRPAAPHRFIFICRKDHLEAYALTEVLKLIAPGCVIVPIPGDTAGALCTVLLAMDYINNDDELLIANADQYLDIPMDRFIAACRADSNDGCIMTFPSTHPKWSYVKLDKNSCVAMVAEKRPISKNATVGLYYFRSGKLFVGAA
jgi:NDP-sugar pyrophosphorylase family protein